MHHRTLEVRDLHVRDADDGTLELDGLAVPWDSPIDYGGIRESFAPGSIDPDSAVGRPLLWSHDRSEPIGHITAAADNGDGLAVTAVVQPTNRGRDAITLLRAGSLRGLSVGFQPVDMDTTPHGVTYTRAIIHELSTTPLPAYDKAAVTATRAEEDPVAQETTETREAPVDLAPLQERIDQLQARIADLGAPREPQRTLSVREAFVMQLMDSKDHRHIRALADVISSGNTGVMPPAWSSEVTGYVDSMRYLFPRTGTMGFPATGHTLTVPNITQHTLVASRGAEKSEIPSRAFLTEGETFTAAWAAGGVDVSLEVIWQSDPSIWGLIVEDLLRQYAIATDEALTVSAEGFATPAGAALDTSDYGSLVAQISATSETIRAATGYPGDRLALTTASWIAVNAMVDGVGRRVFASSGQSNADGSSQLTSSQVDIGGIMAFHNPRATDDLQYNEVSLRKAEKPPVTLTSDNVALMGRDVGVLGAIISLPLYPAGIIGYTATRTGEPRAKK